MVLTDALARLSAVNNYVFLSTNDMGQSVFYSTYGAALNASNSDELNDMIQLNPSDSSGQPNWISVNERVSLVPLGVQQGPKLGYRGVLSTLITNSSVFVPVPMSIQVRTYGYGFNTSLEVLAFIVLLFHVAMVVVHLLMVVWVDKGWTSNAWGGLGELLALAARSRPSNLLDNTGAGVHLKKTWRIMATVRESEFRDGLEFVLAEESASGEKERQDDDSDRIPRPDVEYR